ncbi:MAG: tyrosine--tRNA ligase [Nanoarchaeota archaeon]|nr:tyrosine--tRNA ligase [Nanoarchaeota archaeon]MBU1854567.1 tyrosine--tRNA ligase [Nanoarchaeota archaeon]
MTVEKRLELIKQVGEEITTTSDLKALLEEKKSFVAYDGFEPSGTMHIAQGILRAININKMTKAGAKFKMLVADWHGWANNKMGGDLEKIQKVGKYFIEVWKACGMDLDNVEFVWVSDLVNNHEYWKTVMQIARNSTVNRIVRCGQIMGRKEGEVMQASQILYPCMQAADIFHLKADVCQLGMDQRKVNMLAREIGPKLGYWKPVIVSHHMLMGLGQPASQEKDAVDRAIDLKMSKSKPDSAIFMTDSTEDINRKINKAYCPQGDIIENPILEYCKYIIFEKYKILKIERPDKFGGNLEFNSYEELENDYVSGKLHPLDLKKAIATKIDELIEPVRKHFENNIKARKLKEEVESFKVTR